MKKEIQEARKFGVTLSIVFIIISLIIFLKRGHLNAWLLWASALICVFALFLPKALAPIYKVWIKITSFIGKVISCVVLGVFFYFVIVPVGLLMKVFSKDPLHKKFDKNADTYWLRRDTKLADPKRIEKQY